jgi:hypothetical protein
MSKALGKHFAVSKKPRLLETSFFKGCFSPSKCKREDLLAHINMVKALEDQLRSIEVKIEDEDVYMVLLMSIP